CSPKDESHGCHITSHNSYRRNRCFHTIECCEREPSPRRGPRRALVRQTHSLVFGAFGGLWFALLLPLRPFSLLLQRPLSLLLQMSTTTAPTVGAKDDDRFSAKNCCWPGLLRHRRGGRNRDHLHGAIYFSV